MFLSPGRSLRATSTSRSETAAGRLAPPPSGGCFIFQGLSSLWAMDIFFIATWWINFRTRRQSKFSPGERECASNHSRNRLTLGAVPEGIGGTDALPVVAGSRPG